MKKTNNDLEIKIRNFISIANPTGWFGELNHTERFEFSDQVFIDGALEYIDDPLLFLEYYDQMEYGVLTEIDGVSFDSEEIENIIFKKSNMMKFEYCLDFSECTISGAGLNSNASIVLRFIQLGDGIECGYSVDYFGVNDKGVVHEWIEKQLM